MRQRPKDLRSQRRLLKELHGNFISAVKEGRGERLKPEEAARLHAITTGGGCLDFMGAAPSKRRLTKLADKGAGLFDGSVYTGEVGRDIGMVDSVGDLRTELQRRFGRFVRLENVEPENQIDYSRLLRWLL